MNIHEHQAKLLLSRYGVNVPRGYDAYSVEEAIEVAEKLAGPVRVVKAQIHAGGRGKGGGVKVVDTLEKLKSAAEDILGMQLVTHQTGPEGQQVKRLYIEEGCNIARELYLGVLVDRASNRISMIASTEGGMDIEEVAAKTPQKIISIPIDPTTGLQPHHARRIAFALNLEGQQIRQAIKFFTGIYTAFTELDASLIEINPLAVLEDGTLLALDAKMNFDSNALFRHPEIEELRDEDEEDPAESEAVAHDLSYIKLDGNIGCMVNGAGLAMATMDIIKLYGGSPANFLDVGGGASTERVTVAFKIILSDPGVKAILVNIFGGILRCDVIAQGILEAVQQVQIHVPVVVRMEGTNVERGKTILAESGLPFLLADGMADAAEKAVLALHKEV